MHSKIFSTIITGATSGFGEAIAKLLAEAGTPLILMGRRTERLEKLRALLIERAPVHILTLDVRESAKVSAALSFLPKEFSQVGVLVNNAGLALGLEPAPSASLDDWETMVDTNIKGLMYCTRAVLPGMVQRKHGHIINMGSVAASWPYPGGNVYGASKAFVQQFSRNLRAELQGTNVRVTLIEPGLAKTEFSDVRFKGESGKAEKVYEGSQPLSAADVAETVKWALSRPRHVNINSIEIMPTCQAWGPLAIHRERSS